MEEVDIRALRAIGENLPAVIRGEVDVLDIMMRDDVLSKIYTQSLGIEKYLEELTRTVEQISHRHPHLNVLEIG